MADQNTGKISFFQLLYRIRLWITLVILNIFCIVIAPFPLAHTEPSLQNLSTLHPDEEKSLSQEFLIAQKNEFKSWTLQQKLEWKTFKTEQESQRKNWELQEKINRRQFFLDHLKGAERRQFIQEFLKRRQDFLTALAQEKNKKAQEQVAQMNAFQNHQKMKWNQFQESIQQHHRPHRTLWPILGPVTLDP